MSQPASKKRENKKKDKLEKNDIPPPGGLEPPTFRLTAERASRLRHGGLLASLDVVYRINVQVRARFLLKDTCETLFTELNKQIDT